MSALTMPRVTYLGGHSDQTDQAAALTIVFDRPGIVIRRRFRRFLSFGWLDLRGLDVRRPDIVTFVLAPLSDVDVDGATLRLHTDRDPHRLSRLTHRGGLFERYFDEGAGTGAGRS